MGNMKEWGAEQLDSGDPRIFGMINKNNANYMWIQHFVYHMKPNGKAGFVISNGALTSSNEADLITRKRMLERNIIDCVVASEPYGFDSVDWTALPSGAQFILYDPNATGHESGTELYGAVAFQSWMHDRREFLSEEDVLGCWGLQSVETGRGFFADSF